MTLADLDVDLEQEADGVLEPLLPDGTVDESGNANRSAPLGLRLAYRVTYDAATDALEHRVYYPVLSEPTSDKYVRVPTAVRLMIPVVFLDAARPLQLRAEGLLRRLVAGHGPEAATTALRALEAQIVAAAGALSGTPVISTVLNAVLSDTGPARRIGDRPVSATDVQFLPEDGSLAGLLRALQPVMTLDQAGPLPLGNHGSTTSAVLAAAEALIMASSTQGALIVGDDLGEGLDGPATEHLAGALRAGSAQVWLTTRRADAARAFEVGEIVRLTRHTGVRAVHVVDPPADRKEAAVHRHVQGQLLPALTATTVVICEGRHDLVAFSAADRRRAAPELPLAAYGVRIVSADTGSGGGTTQIPRVANLAKQLGYRVVALIDGDPEKTSADKVQEIEDACDVVVRLPDSMAIERAILTGATTAQLRTASAIFAEFGQPDPTAGKQDSEVAKAVMKALHGNGLHEQFLVALCAAAGALPPVLNGALIVVALASAPGYSGLKRINMTDPTATV
ncbi:TOPRIM nucleotidyl transferase/hydrolase domain-containing protein [Kribbella sp. NPDC050241]|uniref:TOPRIM nucleotidyl transferase/hydrolase domain-containing protein n=1 Tax=Kribbella sp. NPDC050241 TaxID=3364115 RepID=UPI0037AE0A81